MGEICVVAARAGERLEDAALGSDRLQGGVDGDGRLCLTSTANPTPPQPTSTNSKAPITVVLRI